MKIVQSFVPTNYQQDLELYLKLTEISVNSILNFYNEVVLYTTPEIAKMVRERKIKYTEINTTLFRDINIESGNYAVPKILCYLEQTSPFIHIDYDVVLLSKLKCSQDFAIGYYDFDFINRTIKLDELNTLQNYYIEDFKKIHPLLLYEIQRVVDFRLLPNFSIFAVNNVTLCKSIFKQTLSFYRENLDIFKNLKHGPSMLEQFLFITYLRYFLNWEIDIQEVLGVFSNDVINPIEYVNNRKQYAKFLHLENIRKDGELLNRLIRKLYEE